MTLSTILLLLTGTALGTPPPPPVSAPNPLALTAEAYKHPSIHQLSWVGRQIASAMANGPFALDEKTTFLYNVPNRAIVIRFTACDAWAVAAALCARDGELPEETLVVHHEEADAVRHFSLAARLTCAQGRDIAEIFLAANEGSPEKWTRSSRMDIHNNYQGIFWALADRKNCRANGLNERVALAAREKLIRGELITLKAGPSRCAKPRDIDAQNPIARLMEFRLALRELDARCGGKKVTSP